MKTTKKPMKKKAVFLTPVSYVPIKNENDLVFVSLQQLIKAQEKHERQIQEAYLNGFEDGQYNEKEKIEYYVEEG